MNGERQMLPVHTIRIRASSPMATILSAGGRYRGDGGYGHGLDRSLCPWVPLPDARSRSAQDSASNVEVTSPDRTADVWTPGSEHAVPGGVT